MMNRTKNKDARSELSFTVLNVCITVVVIVLQCVFTCKSDAALLDRVVAYIDDQAITYSEFSVKYKTLKEAIPGISQEDALNSMINTQLLLQKARKMRLQAATDDDLIKEYVDIIVRSRIVITEDKARQYYTDHRQEFAEKDFSAVRTEIEKYLTELETNLQLKEHLKELRSQADIVVQLKGM